MMQAGQENSKIIREMFNNLFNYFSIQRQSRMDSRFKSKYKEKKDRLEQKIKELETQNFQLKINLQNNSTKSLNDFQIKLSKKDLLMKNIREENNNLLLMLKTKDKINNKLISILKVSEEKVNKLKEGFNLLKDEFGKLG